jgi:multicomponent Na+:H+ antiporter subunit B
MKFKDGIKEQNVIIKCGADKFLPFALTFGIYIILFGTVSPGGGFQGGVCVASGALLLYLGYGYNIATKAINTEVLRINEAIGASLYVILGLLGIAFGLNFARNIFFDMGNVGDLLSAGTITFMGYAVGYKVLCGVGFLLLLMLGLLAPDPDDADAVPALEAAAPAELPLEETANAVLESAAPAAEAVPAAAEAAAAVKEEAE